MIEGINKTNGVIFTIGQGKKDLDTFLKSIKRYGIDCIIDVRSKPYSKFSPFQQKELKNILKKENRGYLYLGNKLGGEIIKDTFCKKKGHLYDILTNNTFRDGLKILWKMRKNFKICLFCAEEDPLECHRFLCIGAILKLKGGIEIVNLLSDRNENFDFSTQRLIKELKLDKLLNKIDSKEIKKAFWNKLHYIYSKKYNTQSNNHVVQLSIFKLT